MLCYATLISLIVGVRVCLDLSYYGLICPGATIGGCLREAGVLLYGGGAWKRKKSETLKPANGLDVLFKAACVD